MLSAEQLTAIACDYWPRSMEAALHPEVSPQLERLRERWRQTLAEMERWRSFVERLKEDLPGFTVGEITSTVDACLRCAVYPRDVHRPPNADWAVVGCMSILAPVYSVFAVRLAYRNGKRVGHSLFFDALPPELETIAGVLSKGLEATFEVQALALEWATRPVPLWVEPHQPPDTTLFHALFTSEPASVP